MARRVDTTEDISNHDDCCSCVRCVASASQQQELFEEEQRKCIESQKNQPENTRYHPVSHNSEEARVAFKQANPWMFKGD